MARDTGTAGGGGPAPFGPDEVRELTELARHAAAAAERRRLEAEPLWMGAEFERAVTRAGARRVLAALVRAGFRVAVRDGRLHVGPAAWVDEGLRGLLARARAALTEAAVEARRQALSVRRGSRPASALAGREQSVTAAEAAPRPASPSAAGPRG